MKKNSLWRVIWIVGIYAILVSILYLVVVYKVQWEDKDLNTYLYFYSCGNEVCTSSMLQDDYYGKVLCEDDICPYIKEINDNNLVLTDGNVSWLYNYLGDEIIDDKYLDYKYIGNNNYVVTNENNKQGIIDLEGNILIDFNYDYIDDYKDGYVVYKQGNVYGVINQEKYVSIDAKYDDIVLINDKMFAFKENNKYYFSYYNGNYASDKKYNYVYSYDDVILVIYDKKLDILNTSLNSLLLMKLDTFYEYDKVGEIDSLNIHTDLSNIYFSLYNGDKYIDYVYDFIDDKLR